MKYTKEDYENLDPLEGDYDVDVVNSKQKLVKCRKPHTCWGGCGTEIQPGDTALNLSGFIDSDPISFYYCMSCMDSWIDETLSDENFDEGEGATE